MYSIFSFYQSTSVSLGNSVIIFGGYDHHKGEQNLKNIGKVILRRPCSRDVIETYVTSNG